MQPAESRHAPVEFPLPPGSAIESARRRMGAGRISCVALTQTCLDRIQAVDAQTQAWAHVDAPGALAAAARLDAGDRRDIRADDDANGHANGATRDANLLRGIPVGVKDIIDVAGMPTRAGSPLWNEYVAVKDAPVVAALRRAGAIVLGKTVTCELACFDPSPTRNPWNLAHTPGGSSSGSAAAVASRMCLGAIGTQTGGSIIRPAAYCGVVGFKPTFRSGGREGIVPVSPHLDHVGAFATSVAEAFRILRAAGLVDAADGALAASKLERPPRLGVLDGMFVDDCSAEMRAMFSRAIETLRDAGAEIIALPAPPDLPLVIRNHRTIMACDAAQSHLAAFAARPEAFGPNITGLIREGLSAPEAAYQAALAHQRAWSANIDVHIASVDALLTPATPATAPASLETTGDPRFNSPWSYAGIPAVGLPFALDSIGMPAGLQIAGARGAEQKLALVAAWIEEVIAFQQQPPILRSAS